jgi:HEAT repeat protein
LGKNEVGVMDGSKKSLSDLYFEVYAMEESKDVKGLIGIIKNSPNKLVIRKAVLALGRLKSPEAVEPLMELVLKNPLSSVRSAAILAFIEIGSNKPTQLLINMLLSSEYPSIAVEAGKALEKIGDSRVVQPLSLFIHDKTQDLSLREEAVEVLGKMKTQDAVGNLVAALDSDLKEKVSGILVKVGKPAVMPLLAELNNNDESTMWEIVTILGEIGDTEATEPLLALLVDESKDEYDRAEYVTTALGKIRDPKTVDSLIKLASEHIETPLPIGSVRTLGDIGDKRAAEPLIAILEDEDTADCAHLRMEACQALGKIRDIRAVESLIRILRDTRNNIAAIRGAAASALVQFDDDRIELPLLQYYSGELYSMIAETSTEDMHLGTLQGISKLIARLVDKG